MTPPPDALAEALARLRCRVTGHPVGTDTVTLNANTGGWCPCDNCQTVALVAQALARTRAAAIEENMSLVEAAANVVRAVNAASAIAPGVFAAVEILAALLPKEPVNG